MSEQPVRRRRARVIERFDRWRAHRRLRRGLCWQCRGIKRDDERGRFCSPTCEAAWNADPAV